MRALPRSCPGQSGGAEGAVAGAGRPAVCSLFPVAVPAGKGLEQGQDCPAGDPRRRAGSGLDEGGGAGRGSSR